MGGLVRLLGDYAAKAVPIQGAPTAEEQQRRWQTIEFQMYRSALEWQAKQTALENRVAQQRVELIETRKELSRLKRAK